MSSREEINARALSTDEVMRDLGKHAARGGMIAVAAQPIRILIQFATTTIMARILAPEDFGLFAMAQSVTTFAAMFSDLGLTMATVQRKEIDQDMVSGLFFINLVLGAVLMPLTWMVAPLAGYLFHEPRVTWLVIALSIVMPLTALGAQHTAILLRTMQYVSLQWAGLAGHILGSIAGIIAAAYTDLGYWSLVVNAWVGCLVTLGMMWHLCRWRPTRVRNWQAAKGSVRFGLDLTGFTLVNFFHRQLDNVLIGWRYGPTELGLYSRAYQLMLMPLNVFNNSLSSALEPSLSRLQHEPDRWRRAYLDALGLTVFLGAGLGAGMMAASAPLVELLYGQKWAQTGTIFYWLSLSTFSGVPLSATGWIYISLGRTRRMFIWSLIFTPVVAVAFWLALPYGAIGVARAYALVMAASLVPGFIFATRGTPVSWVSAMQVTLPLSCAGLLAGLCGEYLAGDGAVLARLLRASVAAGLIYSLFAFLFVSRSDAHASLRERVLTLLRRAGSALQSWRSQNEG